MIGYIPSSKLSDEEKKTILAIAIKRFGIFYDSPITEKRQLKLYIKIKVS